jgi:hypothetical protein
MRPYKTTHNGREVSFACVHWREFPPLETLDHEETAEWLRQQGLIDMATYQRIQVWERMCGLKVMDDAKCRTCPHVRWVEVLPHKLSMLVTLDGSVRTPIVDQTFLASLAGARENIMVHSRPHGTKHSKRNAAWVDVANQEDPDA